MDTSKYMRKHLQKKDSEIYPHASEEESSPSLVLLPTGRTYMSRGEQGYLSAA